MNMYQIIITSYVLFLLLINSTIYKKLPNRLFINTIITVIYFLIIVFRPITLPDNLHYVELFNYFSLSEIRLGQLSFADLINGELGFYILLSICQLLFGNANYQMFFLTISIINFILFFKGSSLILNKYSFNNVKINSLFLPLFLLYISYYGFMYNMIVLRASISISLLYYSVAQKISNKPIKFVFFLLLSLFFHRSAILSIILALSIIFIPTLSRKQYMIIWAIILFIYIFRINELFINTDFNRILGLSQSKDESLFGAYLSNEFVISRYSIRNLYLILILPFFIYLNNNNTFKLLNLFIIGLFIQILFQGIPALGRATDYFIFFSVILSLFVYINIQKLVYKNFFLFIVVIMNYILFYRLAVQ
jgi:hypothetical protein